METEISGNLRNKQSRFLDWLNDGDVDEEGVGIEREDERPFTERFRFEKGSNEVRVWTSATDRKKMTAEKPDFLVVGPGNHIYTDLANLRKENTLLRRKMLDFEGQDAMLMENRRKIARERKELERERESFKHMKMQNIKTIEEALKNARMRKQ